MSVDSTLVTLWAGQIYSVCCFWDCKFIPRWRHRQRPLEVESYHLQEATTYLTELIKSTQKIPRMGVQIMGRHFRSLASYWVTTFVISLRLTLAVLVPCIVRGVARNFPDWGTHSFPSSPSSASLPSRFRADDLMLIIFAFYSGNCTIFQQPLIYPLFICFVFAFYSYLTYAHAYWHAGTCTVAIYNLCLLL